MPVLGKVGLVNKGVYAAGTTYSALDFVKYNGSTFIALKSVKGVTPADDGTNWQYLARGAELALQNNLLTTQANTYALDAAQGPVIKAGIDSLKTDLSNLSALSFGSTTTASSHVSQNGVGYVKRGDGIVQVEGQFTLGSAIPSGAQSNILTNLPASNTGSFWVAVVHISTGKVIRMRFDSTGALQENYTAYDSGEYIVIPFLYTTDN